MKEQPEKEKEKEKVQEPEYEELQVPESADDPSEEKDKEESEEEASEDESGEEEEDEDVSNQGQRDDSDLTSARKDVKIERVVKPTDEDQQNRTREMEKELVDALTKLSPNAVPAVRKRKRKKMFDEDSEHSDHGSVIL